METQKEVAKFASITEEEFQVLKVNVQAEYDNWLEKVSKYGTPERILKEGLHFTMFNVIISNFGFDCDTVYYSSIFSSELDRKNVEFLLAKSKEGTLLQDFADSFIEYSDIFDFIFIQERLNDFFASSDF